MHIEFLVEDSSGSALLEIIVPKIIGAFGLPHTWRIKAYKGIGKIPKNLSATSDPRKRILLDQLPRLLKGYSSTQGIDAVVVVLDSDRNDCIAFLKELKSVSDATRKPETLFRIAIEEIEAWYLGDKSAIQKAYAKAKLIKLKNYSPDSVVGTWELLAEVVHSGGAKEIKRVGWPLPGTLKHEWAKNIGPNMQIDANTSPSFNKFVNGLRKLALPLNSDLKQTHNIFSN